VGQWTAGKIAINSNLTPPTFTKQIQHTAPLNICLPILPNLQPTSHHQILQRDRQLELARLEAITHQSIIQTRLNNQPAKTKSTYDGKKTEFKSWCETEGYSDKLVTEGKMLRFIESVSNRAPHKRGRKRLRMALDSESGVSAEGTQCTISYATMEGYANALMHLWNQQQV